MNAQNIKKKETKKAVLLNLGNVFLGGSTIAWSIQKDKFKNPIPLNTNQLKTSDSLSLIVVEDKVPHFEAAFQQVRDNCGAGALFTWRGETFATTYQEEWKEMPIHKKENYLATVGYCPSDEPLDEPIQIQVEQIDEQKMMLSAVEELDEDTINLIMEDQEEFAFTNIEEDVVEIEAEDNPPTQEIEHIANEHIANETDYDTNADVSDMD